MQHEPGFTVRRMPGGPKTIEGYGQNSSNNHHITHRLELFAPSMSQPRESWRLLTEGR